MTIPTPTSVLPDTVTLRQVLGGLTAKHWVAIICGAFTVFATIVGGSFKLGQQIAEGNASVELNSIAERMRQSLTYDQGKELSRHKELAARTGVAVYFCDPHSPWQRGTCENTNGLLRQCLLKGIDLSVYTQDELDAIADSMNSRPRATHNWLTSLQVFAQTLAGSHQAAASVQ